MCNGQISASGWRRLLLVGFRGGSHPISSWISSDSMGPNTPLTQTESIFIFLEVDPKSNIITKAPLEIDANSIESKH